MMDRPNMQSIKEFYNSAYEGLGTIAPENIEFDLSDVNWGKVNSFMKRKGYDYRGADDAKNLVMREASEGTIKHEDMNAALMYAGTKIKAEPIVRMHEVPIDFDYIHNAEKSPNMGSRFGQDVEPHGRYIQQKPSTWRGDEIERQIVPQTSSGSVRFNKPYVLDVGAGYGEPTNWKNVLSKQYGGLKGRELSEALIKDGYDGVITFGPKHGATSEVVDLTTFK